MPIPTKSLTPLLQVYDMRKSLAWYRDQLGFQILQTYEPEGHLYWAMLKLGEATLMLNAKFEDEDKPATQPPVPDGHKDITLYFDCPDVDAAYSHVTAQSIKAAPPKITYYKMKQLTLTDPDGFILVFQQPAE
jgi:glyoxylase I family protein